MHLQLTSEIQFYLFVTSGLCLIAYLLGLRRREMEAQQADRSAIDRVRQAASSLQKVAAELNTRIREHRLRIASFEQRVNARDVVDLQEIDRALSILRRLTGDLGGASARIDEQFVELKVLAESRIDPVTGVANRRAFDEQLRSLLTLHRKRGQPFALALMDLDRFKDVNDEFGHPAGDMVLRQMAQLMVRNVRDVDHVMRIGGDEFAVLMVDINRDDAGCVVDRLRATIEATTFQAGEKTVQMTASIGMVVPMAGDSAESLYARADAAMYQAKQQGGSRAALHEIRSRLAGADAEKPVTAEKPLVAVSDGATLKLVC